MSAREILRWPDGRLKEVCAAIGAPDVDVRTLAEDLLETMYAAPGRGLAAPQVGVMRRIFVMDVTWKDGTPSPGVYVDPEIIFRSGATARREEACLSIPGIAAEVERPAAITLRWTALDGALHEAALDGDAARCAQHELDHLDGKVIFDRLSAEDRARLEGAYGG